ncbi:MAG: CvpA family protein [Pseudomonadales bacterium]|nr:CvpA family protein [Pseudomonadales bacterium]
MNWADIAILGVVGVSALISLMRGFVREALSLATWVAAFTIARLLSNSLSMLLSDLISTYSTRAAVSFVLLFVATLVVGAMVSHLVKEVIRATGLSGTDRLFGVAFGAVRGMLIVLVVIGTLHWFDFFSLDSWWQESALIPHVMMLEDWTRDNAQSLMAGFIN